LTEYQSTSKKNISIDFFNFSDLFYICFDIKGWLYYWTRIISDLVLWVWTAETFQPQEGQGDSVSYVSSCVMPIYFTLTLFHLSLDHVKRVSWTCQCPTHVRHGYDNFLNLSVLRRPVRNTLKPIKLSLRPWQNSSTLSTECRPCKSDGVRLFSSTNLYMIYIDNKIGLFCINQF
jgi:hypothetical protein